MGPSRGAHQIEELSTYGRPMQFINCCEGREARRQSHKLHSPMHQKKFNSLAFFMENKIFKYTVTDPNGVINTARLCQPTKCY